MKTLGSWLLPLPKRSVGVALLSAFAVTLLCSCHRKESVAPAPTVDPVETELADNRRKVNEAQDALAGNEEKLAATAAALRAANLQLAEKEQVLTQTDVYLRKALAELETVKKSEAWTFADICNLQQQGQNVIALARYRKFIADFPGSPLARHAELAIADVIEETAIETQRRAERMDPTRQEREAKRLLDDGLLTLQELAPKLKNRTRAQVQALLGKPNRLFPDGTEIGYIDKVSSSSGRKGMLIITFDGSYVSALRMDYAGAKIAP